MIAPTIVYDLDGTLADTAEDLMAALNAVLGMEGLAPLPVENARSMIGAGARVLIQRGFAASGRTLDPQKLEVLFGDFLAHYNAHIADFTRLYPGVETALAAFARMGWRQAVCTNKVEGSAKLLMKRLGVAERFAFICGQDTFGVAKPDPKPLLMTIAACGGASKRAIMVGDFGDRHQDRPRRRPPGHCGRLRLHRRAGRRARARPGDLALRRARGGVRGAVGGVSESGLLSCRA